MFFYNLHLPTEFAVGKSPQFYYKMLWKLSNEQKTIKFFHEKHPLLTSPKIEVHKVPKLFKVGLIL